MQKSVFQHTYNLNVEDLFKKAKHIKGTTNIILEFFKKKLKFSTEFQHSTKETYHQIESLNQRKNNTTS